MESFARALANRDVLLLFGITPPRTSVSPERADEIAAATLRRLEGLPLDALVLYDLDDESDRTEEERPFPFIRTMDPAVFLEKHLTGWEKPAIVYRSVGKYESDELATWAEGMDEHGATVLVGASTSDKPVRTALPDGQRIVRERRPEVPLGAVAIPERHTSRSDEHDRLIAKQEAGVSFFVTQVVYDITAAKNLASDYVYACREQGVEPARMIFTLSLCGSLKTLEFLEWLGVDVPRWIRNELANTRDPLGLSVGHALDAARSLRSFCSYLGLPCGFNVESVSNRAAEIQAAVHVARHISYEMLGRSVLDPVTNH